MMGDDRYFYIIIKPQEEMLLWGLSTSFIMTYTILYTHLINMLYLAGTFQNAGPSLLIYHSSIKSQSIFKQRIRLVTTTKALSIVMQMRNLNLSNHSEKRSINNIIASYELRTMLKQSLLSCEKTF